MASEYSVIDDLPPPSASPPRRRGRGWLPWFVLVALVFAAGAAAMGYALANWPLARRYVIGEAQAPQAAAPVRIVTQPPVATPAVAQREQEALDARIVGLEARIGEIDQRASAAVGNADRAEGLLVAFAARRALDRGVALGYIEALLRDRFGDNQPQAVATIIGAGRQPVTLEQLQAGLADLGPALSGGGPDESWLDGLRRELSGLVVVRRATVPSPDPTDRLARARRRIEAGQVGAALAEVARMPARDVAGAWIAAARRYAAARDALDVIETAALLDPRPRPAPSAEDAPAAPAQPATPAEVATPAPARG